MALARTWLHRLVELQVVERSVALGSYAFTALIPLLAVFGAVASKAGGSGFVDRLNRRFELKGAAAATLHDAFAPPDDVANSITVVSVLVLLASALTLSRGLQRLYATAYGLPSPGVRGTPWGLLWIALIPVFLELRAVVDAISSGVPDIALEIALGAVCWTVTPYVLLGRRLPWRVLLPGALLTATAMSVLTVGAVIYMPHSIGSSAEQYGLIGVAFAILGWLIACGFALVGTAVAGAVLVRRGP